MNTHVPVKMGCDLWNVRPAFDSQPPFIPNYGLRGATGHVLDCGMEPGNLDENQEKDMWTQERPRLESNPQPSCFEPT